MEKALIIGATGGIGAAVVDALQGRGVDVTGLSRRDGLDLTDPAAVDQCLGDVGGGYDLIFVATGVLGTPEKALAAIELSEMQRVFAVNTFGPGLILRHVPRLLAKDAPAVCAVLSARVGSIGDNDIGGWHSYRASKAALNQLVRGAAIEMRRTHKRACVAALHPGTVATPFTAAYAGRHSTVPAEQAADNLLRVIDGLGPDDTGQFLDYAGKTIPW